MESPRFWEKSWRLLVFWLVAFSTYTLIPFITPFAVNKMPFTSLDEAIPFLSWMSFFYVTLYLHTFVSFFSVPNWRSLRYLFLAYMTGGALLAACYFFFPTVHESSYDFKPISIFDDLVKIIRFVDLKAPAPTNLFPSGHVFFTVLPAAFYLALCQRRRAILLGFWALVISASTLTIKQHTALDFFVGLILAAAFGIFFGRMAFRSLKRFGQKPII